MPRHARPNLPGVPWHIVQRANNRSDCFRRAGDGQYFLDTLDELSGTFDCAIHAYVLMANHIHLLLTPGHADRAPRLMKQLRERYTRYFNRVHERAGGLWEGRYRSCVTQQEDYLLACHRYIEMNPVRAGIAEQPGDYRWSSFRCNAEGESDPVITPHAVYLELGGTEEARREAYRALFLSAADERCVAAIRKATSSNAILGDRSFLETVEAGLGRGVRHGNPGRSRKVRGLGSCERTDSGAG